ncbi:protein NYNRIN-like [Huso huso]|uniref:Protein NYNRIN-like n=1 Tax=Huso huso TaxID=61971 RepID=A0ABR0ZKF0_HUSHU
MGTSHWNDGPWESIQIDHTGPLPTAKGGYRYILVVVDMFTRWVEAFPARRCDALTTARILWEQVFTRWGFPKRLESDRGTAFTSEVMACLCKMLGVEQHFHIPYHPEASGMVERMNRTLKDGLKKAVLKATTDLGRSTPDWVAALPGVLMVIRATPVRTTGYPPFELMTGRTMRVAHPTGVPTPITSKVTNDQFLQQVQLALQNKLLDAANRMGAAHQYTVQSSQPPYRVSFQIGDQVMLKNFLKGGAWEANWEGPYQVMDKLGETNLKLAIQKRGRPIQYFWFHGDQCKPYQKKVIEPTQTA